MIAQSLQQLAQWCNGTMHSAQGDQNLASYTDVVIDSRQTKAASCFIALKGEHVDGHDYVSELPAGSCAIVSKQQVAACAQIVVSDTQQALTDIAFHYRQTLTCTIVAITGSNGKTSVKEFARTLIGQHRKVYATEGNLNNHLGLPLSLLRIDAGIEVALLEMGANHQGEIAHLCSIAKPDISLVNNVNDAHLEGFGSVQGIADAKGEIYAGMDATGAAIINADDAYASQYMHQCQSLKSPTHILRFGMQQSADLRAKASAASHQWQLEYGTQQQLITLPVMGVHNAYNALAAISIALACGLTLNQACIAIADIHTIKGRLSVYTGPNGCTLIDDSYNASPASMRAAIDVLKTYSHSTLVLGDMAELGAHSETLHAEIGAYASQQGIDALYSVGTLSQACSQAFSQDSARSTQHFDHQAALIDHLQKHLSAEHTLLFKGSRSSKMENVLNALLNAHHNSEESARAG